jgi:tetratricopeptide (TPR) repeat protein
VTPIAGASILADQPTFTWPMDAKAKTYRVEVGYKGGRTLWIEEKVTEVRLPYPATQKPLARGREYRWQVWAVNEDEVHPLAAEGFFVVSAAVAEAMKALQALATSADAADLVLAAATYEAYEVYDEALAVYERLCRQVPQQPALHAARAALYERAGRQDEAKKAWAEAVKLGFVRPGQEGDKP